MTHRQNPKQYKRLTSREFKRDLSIVDSSASLRGVRAILPTGAAMKRTNPSRMSTLAAMQYRRHPEALREMRRASPDDETLEEAQQRLLGYTGQYANREASLAMLSDYVRRSFTSAQDALRWLNRADRRLGVWCAAQVARTVVHLAPDEPRERPLRAIETGEAWARGQATPIQLRAAADAVAHTYASADAAAGAAYAAIAPPSYVDEAAYYAAIAARNAGISIDFMAVVSNAILTFPALARSNPRKYEHLKRPGFKKDLSRAIDTTAWDPREQAAILAVLKSFDIEYEDYAQELGKHTARNLSAILVSFSHIMRRAHARSGFPMANALDGMTHEATAYFLANEAALSPYILRGSTFKDGILFSLAFHGSPSARERLGEAGFQATKTKARKNPAFRGERRGGTPVSESDVAGAIERVRFEALQGSGKRPVRIPVGGGEVLLYRALRTTASGQRNDVLRWLYKAKKGARAFHGSGQLVRINDEPEYRVVWAGLLGSARGTGLYSEILRAIRSRVGAPLRSDRSMSDAAVGAWEKMVAAGGASWVQETERSGYYRINPSHRSRR